MIPAPQIKPTAQCPLPPPGWKCTRTAGHPGPCAAEPSNPTPETHNFVHNVLGYIETRNHMKQMQEFAEKLEQERDIAQAAIADLNQRLIDRTTGSQKIIGQQQLEIAELRSNLREALAQIDLREALNPAKQPSTTANAAQQPSTTANSTEGAEADPYQSEDYQRHVAEVAKTCHADDSPCDSCLAGGICDGPDTTHHLADDLDRDPDDDDQAL